MYIRSVSACVAVVAIVAFSVAAQTNGQSSDRAHGDRAQTNEPTRDEQTDQLSASVDDTLPENLDVKTVPLGFRALPDIPDDNLLTDAKIALGRKLFFDPILSKDNTVACASCHRPEAAFANSDRVAIGIKGNRGKRNVPSLFNRGYGTHFLWDGRASSLEEQVLSPITNPNELGDNVESVIERLKADEAYVRDFNTVFDHNNNPSASTINPKNLTLAIAAFERVLVYGNTKVDRFRAAEYTAMSRQARQGMWIFESRGACWKCHSGENFSDESFHNTGVGFGEPDRDTGRFEHTGDNDDRFRFKTPTLRGVELTAPYMHDGSHSTLTDVVQFYNKGGAAMDPGLDKDIKPLNLSDQEVEYLVEFLKALSQ